MKRAIILLTVVTMCLGCIASAFASATIPFIFGGTTTSFTRATPDAKSVGTTWRISYWSVSNLSSSKTANVKIFHAPGEYASHTWNYSKESTQYHPYTAYANGQTVYMAAKKKSGTGSINISGDFEP